MLFHYGSCKQEIAELKAKIERMGVVYLELGLQAGNANASLETYKKMYDDAMQKIKTLESNHDSVMKLKAEDHHTTVWSLMNEKQELLVKINELENAAGDHKVDKIKSDSHIKKLEDFIKNFEGTLEELKDQKTMCKARKLLESHTDCIANGDNSDCVVKDNTDDAFLAELDSGKEVSIPARKEIKSRKKK